MAVSRAVCHSRRVDICSIPAFRNSRENAGFDDAVSLEAGADTDDDVAAVVAGALFSEAVGRLKAIIFPEELSEPLRAFARASRPTYAWPFR
jgi:hypothetical protein